MSKYARGIAKQTKGSPSTMIVIEWETIQEHIGLSVLAVHSIVIQPFHASGAQNYLIILVASS